MATLYVENVPKDIYEALRKKARDHRKSISAEVLTLLEENIPTADELKRRRKLLATVKRLTSKKAPRASERFSSTEELQRADRER